MRLAGQVAMGVCVCDVMGVREREGEEPVGSVGELER